MIAMPRTIRIVLIGVGCLAIIVTLLCFARGSRMEVYRRFESPDGRYAIVVFRQVGGVCFPGASSDAPGVVMLVDRQGRQLRKANVEMVQQVNNVEWTEKSVHMNDVGDWVFD